MIVYQEVSVIIVDAHVPAILLMACPPVRSLTRNRTIIASLASGATFVFLVLTLATGPRLLSATSAVEPAGFRVASPSYDHRWRGGACETAHCENGLGGAGFGIDVSSKPNAPFPVGLKNDGGLGFIVHRHARPDE